MRTSRRDHDDRRRGDLSGTHPRSASGWDRFNPLMTCYLTDAADAARFARGYEDGAFAACKLYPAHAHHQFGARVTDIRTLGSVLDAMQRIGMPLLIHGEVTDRAVDIFDREAVFIEKVLAPSGTGLPCAQDRARAHHHRGSRRVCGGQRAADRRHDHAAAFDHQPQCDLRRRHPAPCLLSARGQTGKAPSRRSPRGRLGFAPNSFSERTARRTKIGRNESHALRGHFQRTLRAESYAQVFDQEDALDRLEGFASEHGPAFTACRSTTVR